jgi:hypothetical protein
VCQRAGEKQNGGKGRTGEMHGIALESSPPKYSARG